MQEGDVVPVMNVDRQANPVWGSGGWTVALTAAGPLSLSVRPHRPVLPAAQRPQSTSAAEGCLGDGPSHGSAIPRRGQPEGNREQEDSSWKPSSSHTWSMRWSSQAFRATVSPQSWPTTIVATIAMRPASMEIPSGAGVRPGGTDRADAGVASPLPQARIAPVGPLSGLVPGACSWGLFLGTCWAAVPRRRRASSRWGAAG